MGDQPEAITVAKAAKLLDMESRTLRRELRRSGVVVWKVGGRFKVLRSEFDRWDLRRQVGRGPILDLKQIKAEADRRLREMQSRRQLGT